jgi:prepilin peptidase CpaA
VARLGRNSPATFFELELQLGNFLFISWALIAAIQVMLLLSAAFDDVVRRLIPNGISLTIAIAGLIGRFLAGPQQLAISMAIATALFIVLLLLHNRHILGGADVKLFTALSLGLSPIGVTKLVAVTALAGGVLSFIHLAMRYLPRPRLTSARSAVLRRIYTVERWRILRHAPLPYAVAIACGGIWAVLTTRGV